MAVAGSGGAPDDLALPGDDEVSSPHFDGDVLAAHPRKIRFKEEPVFFLRHVQPGIPQFDLYPPAEGRSQGLPEEGVHLAPEGGEKGFLFFEPGHGLRHPR